MKKKPKYCSKCRMELEVNTLEAFKGYNIYTGEREYKKEIRYICPMSRGDIFSSHFRYAEVFPAIYTKVPSDDELPDPPETGRVGVS